MKKSHLSLILAAAMMASVTMAPGIAYSATEFANMDERVEAARGASKELLKRLKDMVTKEAKAKGAAKAVRLCNLNALKRTKILSEELGFEIGRTSHKLRQPKNAPDAWEQGVLQSFQDRNAKGEDLKTMEYHEVVTENGKQVFRYMKAIPLGGVCYNCHGHLKSEVKAVLDELYPNDKARGMIPGELRGAFTVRQEM